MMQDWNACLPNVMTNSGIKEHRILRYHADSLMKARLSYIPDN